jgi:hypothetical protein
MQMTDSRFHVSENERPYKQVSPYFATAEEAQQYIDDNELDDVSVSESFSVNLF